MGKVYDFLDDETTGDLRIEDGDFVTGESTAQHIRDLLITQKGQYRLHPDAGIGIDNFLNEDLNKDELEAAIQAGITNDGASITRLVIHTANDFDIVANYNSQ
jgi:hypothetical protein